MERGEVLTSEIAAAIFAAYKAQLAAANSALLLDPVIVGQLEQQVRDMTAEVLQRTSRQDDAPPLNLASASMHSIQIGWHRAARGIHPIESLRAATCLFGTALPILVDVTLALDAAAVTRVSMTLHEVIMRRVAFASLSYVGFLKEKLQASREDERRRIARELHDRVGHGMGVTLQSLDLLRYYERNRPDEPVEERLDGAINSLTEAMQILQEISAELRRSIGTEGLEGALRKYLASMVSPSIEVRLTAVGELKQLPSNVGEELFLVMREAVHNAVRHGNPTGLWLDIDASGNAFRGSVRDDGNGFDINGVFAQRNGLASMAERAELLHGKLEIVSTCGQGTTVTVWIPAEPGL